MIPSFLALGALWGLGALLNWSIRRRMVTIFGVIAVIIALHLFLPQGHVLRVLTGGDARGWWLVLLVLGGVYGYRSALRALAARAPDHDAAAPKEDIQEDTQRYARHILLREIGGAGQQKLRQARVLVVGAGGLGSPALIYLAAAGVGHLTVVDDDDVALSNLQRQILFRSDDVGHAKVRAAQDHLQALNPDITVEPIAKRLDADLAAALFPQFDVILDGSDNFATRAMVNQAAVAAQVPLLWGALGQWEGQIALFDPARGGPCLACVFPKEPAPGQAPSCAEGGVAGPLPGVIGTMMALEAVKLITGAGQDLRGRMQIFDGLYGQNREIQLKSAPYCPVCGQKSAQPLAHPVAEA